MSSLYRGSPLVDFVSDLYDPLLIMEAVEFTHLDITEGFPGTSQTYTVQECRQKKVHSAGEQNEGTLASQNHTVWQIMAAYLEMAGAPEPCLADQLLDIRGQAWNIIKISFQLERRVHNLHCERIL